MAVDRAISIVAKIGEYLVAPVGRQFGYLIFYERNIKNLEKQVQKLEDRRVEIQRDVEAGTRNAEIIVPAVKTWLSAVDKLNQEANKFLEHEVKANKNCLNGRCPNLKSRYSLSRKAKKKAEEVAEELLGAGGFKRVCQPGPPPGIESIPTEGIKSFDSRKIIMNKVMEALKADGINMIGICGMGGVGKTTMVNEVAKRSKEEKLFDEVVMAVVSQSPDVMKVQVEIADRLGLKFVEESAFVRASRLCERLKRKAKTLVILDDVWQRLELSEIGIPLGGDDHKSCKIVLTSRSVDVCNQMGAQVKFPIHVLREEEAWNLFKEMAEISIVDDERDPTQLHKTQREVANECGGLPIAIITVGRALIDKSESSWRSALEQLQNSAVQEIYDSVDSKALPSLKFSYDWLESEVAKKCFLHCSAFPEDYNIPIEDLVRHGIGLELFQSIVTMDEVERIRDRVHALVEDLKRRYLLLDGRNKKHVKMHDVLRDMAISIASRREENSLMVKSQGGLKDWPAKYRNKNYSAIWVRCTDMLKLPGNLEFPNLRFLQLQYKGELPETPDCFYEGMNELKVLALSNMSIPISLPTSLTCLTNLQTLSLNDCELWGDMSAIGALVNLEILSFTGSCMEELPRKIGQLTHLKLLDLLQCKVGRIPPGVLSSLSKLEELYIGRSVQTWHVENVSPKDRDVARNVVTELASLSNLVALDTFIEDIKFWPRDMVVKKFNITFGNRYCGNRYFGDLFQNELEFGRLDASYLMESGFKMLLKSTKILLLGDVKGLKNILSDLDQDSFENLRELTLRGSKDLEYLIDTTNDGVRVPLRAFPALKSLTLRWLFNCKGIICHGRQLPKEVFTALTKLKLDGVAITGSLFLLSIARGLKQLEILDIRECNMMEEIVSGEGGEHGIAAAADKIEFPKLNKLHLEDLPRFTAFCKAVNGIELPQLEDLQIIDIPNLCSFCGTTSESDSDAIIQPIFFNKKLWKLPTQLVQLSNLRTVSVARCHKLENLFSISVARGLLQLHTLKVMQCDNLEVIVASEAEHEIVANKIEFPKLKILELTKLPNFTAFCEAMDAIEVPHLTNLHIFEIPKLIEPLINKGPDYL